MHIKRIGLNQLHRYNQIPMKKEFDHILMYHSLQEADILPTKPTIIDLSQEEDINDWLRLFDHDHCGVFVAEAEGRWLGGCVVVTHSPKVHMLRGDDSNAVLWDIRVDPVAQHRGIGTLLFETAMTFGREEGCQRMLIETQNNNPRAIRFYETHGATLLEINKNHYPDQPTEDQLIFTIPLSIQQHAGRS